jgi:hypothetical protein
LVITTPACAARAPIPPDSSIRDHEGRIASEISITPVPLDRPPFPLPPQAEPPVYFTVQPGAGYVHHSEGRGAWLVYPNYEGARRQPPDARLEFWHYDPGSRGGWFVYGQGTVTPDASQVIPDPGVEVYEFTGAMINVPGYSPPPTGPAPGGGPSDGDPVDLATGLFVLRKTDLIVSDVLAIMLTRTYRQDDTVSRAFGVGTTHPYDSTSGPPSGISRRTSFCPTVAASTTSDVAGDGLRGRRGRASWRRPPAAPPRRRSTGR